LLQKIYKKIYKKIVPLRFRNKLRSKLLSLRQFAYRGEGVVCPCCGGHFAAFAPFGVVPRPNAACPRCDSLERHRFLWYYLQDHTDFLQQPLRVLHFAPEAVLEPLFRKNKKWNYLTADLVKGLADISFDMQAIPFENDTFDLIICSHVTSYIPDEGLALRELSRILKPQTGVLLQLTRIHKPTEKTFTGGELDTEKRLCVYGFDPYVRWVHGKDYIQILENNQLDVSPIAYNQFGDAAFAQKYGFINSENTIFDGETIYFCKKRR
jgi:hypothetical protein